MISGAALFVSPLVTVPRVHVTSWPAFVTAMVLLVAVTASVNPSGAASTASCGGSVSMIETVLCVPSGTVMSM